jgi:hypothetical protein
MRALAARTTVELSPVLRAALEKAARSERRSLSSMGRVLLERGWGVSGHTIGDAVTGKIRPQCLRFR